MSAVSVCPFLDVKSWTFVFCRLTNNICEENHVSYNKARGSKLRSNGKAKNSGLKAKA